MEEPHEKNTRHIYVSLFLPFAGAFLLLVTVMAPGLGRIASAEQAAPAATPPVADFTIGPAQGVVGTLFFFDPINSSDAEDSDAWLLFRFDFDGDNVWDTAWDNPTNPAARHTYSAPGTYQVKLEIKDTDGMTDTKVIPLQVGDPGANTAPTANCAASPASGPPGTTFTFSAAGSSDAQDGVSGLSVKWDQWGSFDFRGQSWQPATQSVTFTYNSLGTHDVDLLVMDSGYLTADTSCQVEVVPAGGNTPPTANLSITPASLTPPNSGRIRSAWFGGKLR
ncbi:MAG: PKD domain-containing protein [Chloroflexi bacterium]|nr:PKD domain-containing protein [Chloroflexota bacterium]